MGLLKKKERKAHIHDLNVLLKETKRRKDSCDRLMAAAMPFRQRSRIFHCVLTSSYKTLLFLSGSVCKVNTQDPENFDEELKSLVTAWQTLSFYLSFERERVMTAVNVRTSLSSSYGSLEISWHYLSDLTLITPFIKTHR